MSATSKSPVGRKGYNEMTPEQKKEFSMLNRSASVEGNGDEAKSIWIDSQKRTFTRWVNNQLQKKGYAPVDDLQSAFEDGSNLIYLLNALYGIPVPKFKKGVTTRIAKLDNLNSAFQMLKAAEVKTQFLGAENLIDKDLKMILGMVWVLILDHAIKDITVDDLSAKEGLLRWATTNTKGYKHIPNDGLTNFTTNWKDGMAFCALLDKFYPGLVDYNDLHPSTPAKNLNAAFAAAEKELGIPRLLDVEDLVNTPRPDEKSVMTYVSEMYHRLATKNQKEREANNIKDFLNFLKDREAHKLNYEEKMKKIRDWIDLKSEDFSKDVDASEDALQSVKEYLEKEKPEKLADLLEAVELYRHYQQLLQSNGREPYHPPETLEPKNVHSHLEDMEKKERVYRNTQNHILKYETDAKALTADVDEKSAEVLSKLEADNFEDLKNTINKHKNEFVKDINGNEAACVALLGEILRQQDINSTKRYSPPQNIAPPEIDRKIKEYERLLEDSLENSKGSAEIADLAKLKDAYDEAASSLVDSLNDQIGILNKNYSLDSIKDPNVAKAELSKANDDMNKAAKEKEQLFKLIMEIQAKLAEQKKDPYSPEENSTPENIADLFKNLQDAYQKALSNVDKKNLIEDLKQKTKAYENGNDGLNSWVGDKSKSLDRSAPLKSPEDLQSAKNAVDQAKSEVSQKRDLANDLANQYRDIQKLAHSGLDKKESDNILLNLKDPSTANAGISKVEKMINDFEKKMQDSAKDSELSNLKDQYDAKAVDLQNWINDQSEKLKNTVVSDPAQESARHEEYLKNEKPLKQADLEKLFDLYKNLQKVSGGNASVNHSPAVLSKNLEKLDDLDANLARSLDTANKKQVSDRFANDYNSSAQKLNEEIEKEKNTLAGTGLEDAAKVLDQHNDSVDPNLKNSFEKLADLYSNALAQSLCLPKELRPTYDPKIEDVRSNMKLMDDAADDLKKRSADYVQKQKVDELSALYNNLASNLKQEIDTLNQQLGNASNNDELKALLNDYKGNKKPQQEKKFNDLDRQYASHNVERLKLPESIPTNPLDSSPAELRNEASKLQQNMLDAEKRLSHAEKLDKASDRASNYIKKANEFNDWANKTKKGLENPNLDEALAAEKALKESKVLDSKPKELSNLVKDFTEFEKLNSDLGSDRVQIPSNISPDNLSVSLQNIFDLLDKNANLAKQKKHENNQKEAAAAFDNKALDLLKALQNDLSKVDQDDLDEAKVAQLKQNNDKRQKELDDLVLAFSDLVDQPTQVHPKQLYELLDNLRNSENEASENLKVKDNQGESDQKVKLYEDKAQELNDWIKSQEKALDPKVPSAQAVESYQKHKPEKLGDLANLLDLYADIQKNGWCSLEPAPETLKGGFKELDDLSSKNQKSLEDASNANAAKSEAAKYEEAANRLKNYLLSLEPKLKLVAVDGHAGNPNELVGNIKDLEAKKNDLENLLQQFRNAQAVHLNNNLPVFNPAEGLHPKDLEKKLSELQRLAAEADPSNPKNKKVLSSDNQKKEYEKRAPLLLSWINEKLKHISNLKKNVSSSKTMEVKAVQAELESLRNYIKNDKGPQLGENLLLASLFAEIQKDHLINGVSPYVPEKPVPEPEALKQALSNLHNSETDYEDVLLKKLETAVAHSECRITPEMLKQYENSFKAFDSNGDNVLEKNEFRSCCQAQGIVFAEEKQFEDLYKELSANNDGKHVDQESFKNWVIRNEGSRGSIEGLLTAFKFLTGNSDPEHVDLSKVKAFPLTDEDIAVLAKNMPQNADGTYNLSAWANQVKD